MDSRAYTATKTRSDRPGWSVIFSHPRRADALGKSGLKVRRGLGTQDDSEADRLVAQLNELLADQSWWSLDRRAAAAGRFDSVVVAAFYDEIEVGKEVKSWNRRENSIPLPTKEDGYARVMLVGSTGAGKTTLLRQLIGSDPKRDRFPSTSTAKTTIADIEIITAEPPFRAAVTFMTEHETRCAVDECLEEAFVEAVRGHDDAKITNAMLEHKEQRFRMSYLLGAWQEIAPSEDTDGQRDLDYDDDDDESETDALPEAEAIAVDEAAGNKARLDEYVVRIKTISQVMCKKTTATYGDFQDLKNANQREAWREAFADNLYQSQDFAQLSLDIMDVIKERFDLVESGVFEHGATGWPVLWFYEEHDREAFLKQVRWFSSNHDRQFGRLLTPLVDGVRVSGPFQPSHDRLRGDIHRLVLLDGEGLGHSAKEANSISTKVTEKFAEADMILLVDNAQSPMQAAPLELMRSVGSSGHGHKLAVAFTHFDLVRGDNLSGYQAKRNHVRASTGNAIGSLRESLGPPMAEILENQLSANDFYLGGLDKRTCDIKSGFIENMRELLDRMKDSAKPRESIDLAPYYNMANLAFALRDATDEFKKPWRSRLGLDFCDGFPKEHWTRPKALCRRIANGWDNEYNDLRPVADLIRELQGRISLWLNNPEGWTREPKDRCEAQAAIDLIRQQVFGGVGTLAEQRLIAMQIHEWRKAFAFTGTRSSSHRADVMGRIYESAAPHISYGNTDPGTHDFLCEIKEIVSEAVKRSGGSVKG